MNYKMIFYTIGRMLNLIGFTVLFPMIVAIAYSEPVLPYIIEFCIFEAIGLIFAFKKPKNSIIYTKEATVSIALAWIFIGLLGAILYVISGAIPSYTDAVFEMVSGITTTGSTILAVVETLPKGILFFRSFTNLLGGIGILVFILALSTNGSANAIFFLKAESTGPSKGKMTNKTQNSALITYLIYFGLTLICFISLLISGLDWFNALCMACSTAGTGGFAPTNLSVISYNNLAAEIIMTVFMYIFAINFGLYFLMLTGKFLSAIKNEEFLTFTGLFVISIILITLNITSTVGDFWTALRYASFEVATSISDCGFAVADINLWPAFSQTLLLLLMIVGGCAGSTAGGLKVSRFLGLVKSSKHKISQTVNPRKVLNIKIDGKIQDESYVNSLFFYFAVYIAILLGGTLVISLDPALDFGTSFSAMVAIFNNAGPGLGIVGPVGNFSTLSHLTKWFLSFIMLLGRLEIFPFLILFMPSTWNLKKKLKSFRILNRNKG